MAGFLHTAFQACMRTCRTAHAAADANTIAAAAPQPHPMATADVGARHSMLEP